MKKFVNNSLFGRNCEATVDHFFVDVQICRLRVVSMETMEYNVELIVLLDQSKLSNFVECTIRVIIRALRKTLIMAMTVRLLNDNLIAGNAVVDFDHGDTDDDDDDAMDADDGYDDDVDLDDDDVNDDDDDNEDDNDGNDDDDDDLDDSDDDNRYSHDNKDGDDNADHDDDRNELTMIITATTITKHSNVTFTVTVI